MATVRILSWNIQKLNEKKRLDTNFINFMAKVILNQQADIVGIMEIVNWQGDQVTGDLAAELNNLDPRPGTWKGKASERQWSQPNEQYVFMWRDQTNQLTARERDFDLTGVLKDETFQDFGNKAKQNAIWGALMTNRYIDFTYKVNENKEAELKGSTPLNLSLSPSLTLSAQEKADIKTILRNSISAYFPRRNSRSPFTGQFTLANNSILSNILFHAPGPSDPDKYQAINNLYHVNRAKGAQGVIMGDFNIRHNATDHADHSKQVHWINESRQKVPLPGGARGYEMRQVFEPLTAAPPRGLGYTNIFDHTQAANRTSLSDTMPAGSTNSADGLLNPYDKFLVKGMTVNSAEIVDLLSDIHSDAPSGIQQLAINVYNNWSGPHLQRVVQNIAGIQARVVQHQTELANVAPTSKRHKRLRTMLMNAKTELQVANDKANQLQPIATIPTLQDAHKVYGSAISDHLPIVIELQY